MDKFGLEDIMELLAGIGKPGQDQFPVKIQMHGLGLTPERMEELKGKRILDPCCGKKGNLVEHLRDKGIIAEGMDPGLEVKSDYLVKRGIAVSYTGEGSIPKPDNYYEGIYAHAFNQLFYPFAGLEGFYKFGTRLESTLILTELLRVLKPQGTITSCPSILELDSQHLGIKTHPLLDREIQDAAQLMRHL